ncbi:piggyBac transposable element-derived protein 5 [Mastomys coucha]|uniref:piggyBac transposable element-derived protein 5 n=1 Tax=Mastomys coucha TaxID=35658 RepID=UPI0012628E39|nr:piggyBac transposable element-derived protein 5 [Mastomys coucha]
MAEGSGGARRRAPALLEAARARYESLHISDDVFGESGPDSGGNPFYSTSAASRSSSAASSDDERERPAPPGTAPPPHAADPLELEEDETGAGWSAVLRDRPPPRFEDTGGPTRKMPPSASAVDFFQLFVPDNVLKNMVVQTNMYARKFQERFGSDGAWVEVTLAEMKAFLGYVISTSVSHCESVLSIWSGGFYSNRSLALVMSQARFEKILKYFHVVAFRSSQTTHGLYKVQPFLDSLQSGFDAAFRPSQTQVLHEPLIDEDPVFIATCTERELRKRKKRKFSLWVRQCSSTGFIIQIYVHLKEGGGPDGLDALKNKPQLHGMVARSLCKNAAGKNYIIFTGPSITSLNLFEEFEKQGIYCCGLLSSRKSDCTGLPPSMLTNPVTPLARGQHQIRTKGNMSLICWYNKGHFRFLTNAYSPVQQGVIIKRRSGEIPCPLAVEAFAAHLSYICRYDDKYSKYFISHKPNKTWQQVFWFAISIAVNNAYILYKMSDAYHVKRYSRAQFGERLVRELLGLEVEDTSPAH